LWLNAILHPTLNGELDISGVVFMVIIFCFQL
jgi:hypothetical protein